MFIIISTGLRTVLVPVRAVKEMMDNKSNRRCKKVSLVDFHGTKFVEIKMNWPIRTSQKKPSSVPMWFRKFILDFFRTNLYQNFPLSFYSTRKCMAYIRYWVRSKSMPWRVDGQVWHIYAWTHA